MAMRVIRRTRDYGATGLESRRRSVPICALRPGCNTHVATPYKSSTVAVDIFVENQSATRPEAPKRWRQGMVLNL